VTADPTAGVSDDELFVAPVSFAQQRLWFVEQIASRRVPFTVQLAYRLSGRLDDDALAWSLEEIVRRHEALRTAFVVRDGAPVQLIAPRSSFALDRVDPDGRSDEAAVVDLAGAQRERPFDLERGPVLRGVLARVREHEHVLLVTFHHIAFDGWSASVFERELAALYSGAVAGSRSPLEELPIQYADFAVWQRERLTDSAIEELTAYWHTRLAGLETLDLPTDRPRPADPSFRGGRLAVRIDDRLTGALDEMGRSCGATLYMTLFAAFQVLLHRYTGQTDVSVAAPVANRTHEDTEGLIGFFVNVLVLRTDLSGDPTFRELLARVRDVARGAFAHQDLPFERLVEVLRPDRGADRNPLARVMFEMSELTRDSLELPGVDAVRFHAGQSAVWFDLEVHAWAIEGALEVHFAYGEDLYDEATIERMAAHYVTLVEAIARDPNRRIGALQMLTEAERERAAGIRSGPNRTRYLDETLDGLFREQVRRTPEATALLSGSERVSYAALDRRVGGLVERLRAAGVKPEDRVGISLDRDTDFVVSVLAVLEAGGAYVPLDPSLPPERLAFMAKDSGVSVLVARGRACAGLGLSEDACLFVDRLPAAESGGQPRRPSSAPASLAAVIYTSGSTGRPKGVALEHRAVLNRLSWMWEAFPFGDGEVSPQKTSTSFVDSLWELLGPLLRGVPTVLIPDDDARDPSRLVAALAAAGATRVLLVPSLLRAMLDAAPDLGARLPSLALWVSSGEPLSGDLARRVLEAVPGGRLVNVYGMSEYFDATAHEIARDRPASGSVGRPIANARVYVLDRYGNAVPTGVTGEVHVAGAGLARGYFGRPELTAERFAADPFVAGERMYRTGDLGRLLPDGAIELVGRGDHQVKVRGVRVELGEVEAVLREHSGVRDAAVVAEAGGSGDTRLSAFVVPASAPAPSTDELREHLRTLVAEQAIPAAFAIRDSLPRTPAGKLDRRALLALERPRKDAEAVPPRTDLERTLLSIWEETLGQTVSGVSDNFFDLGGHSLLAVKLFARVEAATGRRLPLASLFDAPTIERLARLLEAPVASESWRCLVPITACRDGATRRPPLILVHGIGGDVLGLRALARSLGDDQPLYGLRARGLDGRQPRHDRIQDMATDYLDEVLAAWPEGPYMLGGQSFGGYVAYEMARQLVAAGRDVALLALLDTYGPDYLNFGSTARRMASHLGSFLRLAPRDRLEYAKVRADAVHRMATRRAWRVADRALGRLGAQLPEALGNVEGEHYLKALRAYDVEPYSGRVTLFRASEQPVGIVPDGTSGWAPVAGGGVEVFEVPGGHESILFEPNVATLAGLLRVSIDRARIGQ
jgi:amino acid adenylation domain-containing protein